MAPVHFAETVTLLNTFLNTTDQRHGKGAMAPYAYCSGTYLKGEPLKLLSQGQQRINVLNGDDGQKHGI